MYFSLTPSFGSGKSYEAGPIDAPDLFSADCVLGAEGPPAASIRRTRLCRYYAKEKGCRHGAACPFAHGDCELVERPDLTKTSLCRAWLAGLPCAPGIAGRCLFAHGSHELRVVRGGGDSPEDCGVGLPPGCWQSTDSCGGCRSASVRATASAPAANAVNSASNAVWLKRLTSKRDYSWQTHLRNENVSRVMDLTTPVQRSNESFERLDDKHVGFPVLDEASTLDVATCLGGDTSKHFWHFPQPMRGCGQMMWATTNHFGHFAHLTDENATSHSTNGLTGTVEMGDAARSEVVAGMTAAACFSTQVMQPIVTSQQQHAWSVLEQFLISTQPDHYYD